MTAYEIQKSYISQLCMGADKTIVDGILKYLAAHTDKFASDDWAPDFCRVADGSIPEYEGNNTVRHSEKERVVGKHATLVFYWLNEEGDHAMADMNQPHEMPGEDDSWTLVNILIHDHPVEITYEEFLAC